MQDDSPPVIQGVTEGPNLVGSTPSSKPAPLPPNGDVTFAPDTSPVPSYVDENARADEQSRLDPGFLGSIPLAVQSDWASSWAFRQMGSLSPEGPAPTEEQRKHFLDTIPEAYWDLMDGAHSAAQLEQRRQWAVDDMDRERRLAAAGWTGWSARLLTNLFDPTAVGAMMATDGVAAPYIAGLKVGRLGKLFATALEMGTSNAALTAAESYVNPKIDAETMAESFGMGLIWGGVVGHLRSNPHTQEEANRFIQIGQKQVAEAREQGSSVGAAASGNATNPLVENAPIIDGPVPQAALTGLRYDSVGQLGGDKVSKSARLYGPHLGEESVGFTDHSAVPNSASEIGSRLHRAAVVDWFQTIKPAYSEWAKDNGVSWLQRNTAGREYKRFMNEVSNFVEDRDPMSSGYHSATVKAGTKFRKIMKSWAELGRDPGYDEGVVRRPIAGFENIEADDHYVPKYSDPDKINSLYQRFSDSELHKFVKRAVLSAVPDMKDEIAHRVAAGWLKRIRGAGYGIKDDFSAAFNTSNADTIRTALRDLQIDDTDIEQIIGAIGKKDTAGESSRTKRRSPLNYTYSEPAAGSKPALSMKDFFVSDADELLHRYSREMSGRVALAKVQIRNPDNGELIVDGITSKGEYDTLISHIAQDYAVAGASGKEAGLKRARENMEYLYRAILGQAHHHSESYVPWLRRMREANVIRLMNRLGLNQAQEVSLMISQVGLKAMLSQMPALRRVINGAGDKVLNSRLAQELEAGTGLGTDQFFGQARFHHLENIVGEHGSGRIGRAIDNTLTTGKGITSSISLMRHVNSYLQQWTSKAIAQRFADMAFGRGLKGLSGKNPERIRALGLNDATAERIFNEIRTHATVSGSRRKLDALNMEKWDPALRSQFLNSVYRYSRRIVLENDAGNLNRWMSTPGGQMLLQFRTFIFGAWAKRTLANLHHLDMTAFSTLMAEIMLGAATHAVNVYTNAATRSDAEDYKAQQLTIQRLAAAGFGRSGISSILPTIVDSALAYTTGKPYFDARTSATANDILFGVPLADWIKSSSTFSQGLIGSTLEGRQMSQREIYAGQRSLPFGNWWPVAVLMGKMFGDRPYHEPKS
jgi:hypothetical protein